MSFDNFVFNRGKGGLGKSPLSQDHISGIVFQTTDANLPAGFSSTARLKLVQSVEDAEDLSILSSDANVIELHYHISEFFRMNATGKLWVYIGNSATANSLDDDLESMQVGAKGEIRQALIVDTGSTFSATTTLVTIDTKAKALAANHQPIICFYVADVDANTEADLPDLKSLTSERVGFVIGSSLSGMAAAVNTSKSMKVCAGGSVLGAMSSIDVASSIGEVGAINYAGDGEFESVGTGWGKTIEELGKAKMTTLHDNGYIIMRGYTGKTGVFANRDSAAVAFSSDYSNLSKTRTLDKAQRNVYSLLLDKVNAKTFVNAEGQIREDSIAEYKNIARRAMKQMVKDGEVSAYDVLIDPAQDINTTGKLSITLKVIPVGLNEVIEVNLGFTTKL